MQSELTAAASGDTQLPSAPVFASIRRLIIDWQREHGRHHLPWQQAPRPYHVLISEVMLQQTQVSTVIPYFQRWLQRFPDFTALAQAPLDDVLAEWQGLGYYARARNLHKAAQYVVAEYGTELPAQVAQLREIPGIGPYTAGAIANFAFDQPAPIVDGNVKRLFARLFRIPGHVGLGSFERAAWRYAEALTPAKSEPGDARALAQGLLDIGATLCKPKQANCAACPLTSNCGAYQHQQVNAYPAPKPKRQQPTRAWQFIWDRQGDQLLLEQRPHKGIWGGLWCLPQLQDTLAPDAAETRDAVLHGEFLHTFTHFKLQARVLDSGFITQPPWQFSANDKMYVPLAKLDEFGLPAPIKQYISDQLALACR